MTAGPGYPHVGRRADPLARFDIDGDDVARGFGQLVLALADVLRELLERQAIRRMEAGDLTDDQIERLGSSLLRIGEQIADLRTALSPDAGNEPRRNDQ